MEQEGGEMREEVQSSSLGQHMEQEGGEMRDELWDLTSSTNIIKQSYPRNRSWRPIGL
jgi:hypothetical protein